MNKQISPHNRGFSLIELLVVIAIITILTGTLIIGLRTTRSSANLDNAALQIVTTIREARQYSIAIRELDGKYPAYGVYLEKDSANIILYADCVPDDNNDTDVPTGDNFHYTAGETVCDADKGVLVETRPLAGDVTITSIEGVNFDSSTISPTNLSILYLAPEPTTWFSVGNALQQDLATTNITLGDGQGNTVVVTTNLYGFVEINR